MLSLLLSSNPSAQKPLAPTPPMGWNSWDAYGSAITEKEVRANADAMARDLKSYGWQYVVVDIQWYEPNARAGGYRPGATLDMDEYARLIPAANRFPSAANGAGFKPLADYVHSLGLKFGIHILRGVPRQAVSQNVMIAGTKHTPAEIADTSSICQWNTDMYGVDMSKPGAQAYYDSLAALYASWGVDFIKADDMSRPYHSAEIAALHKAIVRSGRPMVLSLSPGPAPAAQVASLRENANMWRVSDDVWDEWRLIRKSFDYAETWAPLIQPGHWPDQDMLPLGHIGIRAHVGDDRMTRLTKDEQRSLMSLWAINRSPLIFGGDLPTLDPWTKAMLTNQMLLDLDQHSTANRLVSKQGDIRVWEASEPRTGATYVALFNLGDQPHQASIDLSQLSLKSLAKGSAHEAKDVWPEDRALDSALKGSALSTVLPSHGVRLLLLR